MKNKYNLGHNTIPWLLKMHNCGLKIKQINFGTGLRKSGIFCYEYLRIVNRHAKRRILYASFKLSC